MQHYCLILEEKKEQSWLSKASFPTLHESYIYLLRVLIGSLDWVCLFWMANCNWFYNTPSKPTSLKWEFRGNFGVLVFSKWDFFPIYQIVSISHCLGNDVRSKIHRYSILSLMTPFTAERNAICGNPIDTEQSRFDKIPLIIYSFKCHLCFARFGFHGLAKTRRVFKVI